MKKILSLLILSLNIQFNLCESTSFLSIGTKSFAQTGSLDYYGFELSNERYCCKNCDFSTNDEREMVNHSYMCENKIVCLYCNKPFSFDEFVLHDCPEDPSKKFSTCDKCGQSYLKEDTHVCPSTPPEPETTVIDKLCNATTVYHIHSTNPSDLDGFQGTLKITDKFGFEYDAINVKGNTYVSYNSNKANYWYCTERNGLIIIINSNRHMQALINNRTVGYELGNDGKYHVSCSASAKSLFNAATYVTNKMIQNRSDPWRQVYGYGEENIFNEFVTYVLGYSFNDILRKMTYRNIMENGCLITMANYTSPNDYHSYLTRMKEDPEHWKSLSGHPKEKQIRLAYEYASKGYIVMAVRYSENGKDNISVVLPEYMGCSEGWDGSGVLYNNLAAFDARVKYNIAKKPLSDIYLYNRANGENDRKDVEFIVFKW